MVILYSFMPGAARAPRFSATRGVPFRGNLTEDD
jgi:hypothetical protein